MKNSTNKTNDRGDCKHCLLSILRKISNLADQTYKDIGNLNARTNLMRFLTHLLEKKTGISIN